MEPRESWKRAKSRGFGAGVWEGEKGGQVRPHLLQAEGSSSPQITPTPPPFHCSGFRVPRQAARLERTAQEPCVPAALLGRSRLLPILQPAVCRGGEGTATQEP